MWFEQLISAWQVLIPECMLPKLVSKLMRLTRLLRKLCKDMQTRIICLVGWSFHSWNPELGHPQWCISLTIVANSVVGVWWSGPEFYWRVYCWMDMRRHIITHGQWHCHGLITMSGNGYVLPRHSRHPSPMVCGCYLAACIHSSIA